MNHLPAGRAQRLKAGDSEVSGVQCQAGRASGTADAHTDPWALTPETNSLDSHFLASKTLRFGIPSRTAPDDVKIGTFIPVIKTYSSVKGKLAGMREGSALAFRCN